MIESIHTYVLQEEAKFETEDIRLGDNWSWNFRDHVQMIFHLKNSQFFTGENDYLRAFKNVMEPILNLSYWSEDIEVKDVVFYITGQNGRVLSFLIKKYHDEIYVKEHDLDTFFDELTESDIDYGGALIQKGSQRPEVIDLTSLAFCDQNDLMGGPRAVKMHFSPSQLLAMSKYGWGDEKNGANITLQDLVVLAENKRDPAGDSFGKENETTGKVVEVYVVRGSLPEHYLKDNGNFETYYDQVQIIAFYVDEKGKKKGVTLFRKKDTESQLFHTSKKVNGRALGRGVGESLIHPQVWTNFLEIHKMKLLEAGSKVVLYTDDESYQNRNLITDMDNLEITTTEEGKSIQQVPTLAPNSITLFQNSVNEWFEHSQLLGAAFDPILGKEATSGTTFRGQERTVAQGRGLHDRRRGQRAKFIEQVYRKWIIPDIVKEILNGKEFLASLTAEELQWVNEQLAENFANREQIEALFNLQDIPDKEFLKAEFKRKNTNKGNQVLLKILKDEFRGIEIKIGINVSNKQKDLVNLSDKILSIFQFVFANPQQFQQAMQIPALAKSFNDILEFSGLNQSDFLSLVNTPQLSPIQPSQNQELKLNNEQG